MNTTHSKPAGPKLKLWLMNHHKFGVQLITDRCVRQLRANNGWLFNSQNDGIKFCIMPTKRHINW